MRRQGFTLVEVLIAASVTSLVVISIAQMQGTSLFSMRQARQMRQATDLASRVIEEIRAQPSDTPSLCTSGEREGFVLSCSSALLRASPASYLVRLEVERNRRSYLSIQTIVSVHP